MGGILTGTVFPSAGGGGSSPSIVSFSAGNNTSGSGTMTITAPSSIVNGNVLVAGVAQSAGVAVPPVGWSTAVTTFIGSGSAWLAVFYKIASGESGNYTFTAIGAFMSGSVINISGANASPLDIAGTGQGGTGTTATALGVTTTSANDLLLYFSSSAGTGAVGIPSGFSDTGNVSGGGSTLGYSSGAIAQAAAGASGDKTASTQTPWAAVLIGIKP